MAYNEMSQNQNGFCFAHDSQGLLCGYGCSLTILVIGHFVGFHIDQIS